ncbi:hypothetical protein QSJ11_14650 [Vibrio parahaemolyticus]|nr:hypothetical protein QSJ11_14650 [Vibrio parahaemolyticus]
MKKTLLSLFMVSVSFAVVGEEARYTMDDLKALNGSKNWNELLAHAEDIRPSQRNSEWESLVQNAALGAFEHYVASGAKDDAIGLGQQLILSYPFLSQSKSFTLQFLERAGACSTTMYSICDRGMCGKLWSAS